jgi:hypothetical protein
MDKTNFFPRLVELSWMPSWWLMRRHTDIKNDLKDVWFMLQDDFGFWSIWKFHIFPVFQLWSLHGLHDSCQCLSGVISVGRLAI